MTKDKDEKPTQWHPYFAAVLRLLVQEHYDVQTNMPVGDKPRAADIVLVRRKSRKRPKYRGLLRHLTEWNVVEFKGRTVFARSADLPLLVEVGLGIHRRLNEERERSSEGQLPQRGMAFWYIANELGPTFLRDAEAMLGPLIEVTSGVWQCSLLRHLVFLISSVAVPVERDTTPLHLLAEELPDNERALMNVLIEEPGLWEMYSPVLGFLHPNIWEEAKQMARSKKKYKVSADGTSMGPLIETFGMDAMVKAMGVKEIVEAIGIDEFLAHLTPKQMRELKERVAKSD